MENIPTITKIFLFALSLKFLLEAWLDKKNKQHILKHRTAVPDKFKDQISLADHQKAADYSVEKIKSSSVFQYYDVALLLAFTLGGGLNLIDGWALQISTHPLGQAVIFFALFGLISTLLSLPQSLYSTFVIEQKYGFNKTTPKLFIADMVKGLLLGAIIGLPIIAAIVWFIENAGQYWWVIAWAFLVAIQFILMWAYPVLIAPLFNKFSPLEEGETKEKILELLKRTGFESNGLFVMDASKRSGHGNAYFTGFGKNKRIVFFDNLINTLTPSEVEAVLAHELGHFKKRHVIKLLIKAVIMSLIGFAIMGALFQWEAFFTGHGVSSMSAHMGLALFGLVAGVYTFFMTPLSAMWSRKFEFEADEFAAKHADAQDLINALVKLYKDNASTLTPDPTYSQFYHSHPPAFIRVNFLEQFIDQKNQVE